MTSLLDRLTPEQRAAACSDLQSTAISAAPGSGKTQVIAARIATLLGRAEPHQILCLVFTRTAAAEIALRLQRTVGDYAQGVRIQTFHGYAAERVLPRGSSSQRVATATEVESAARSLVEGKHRLPPRKNPGIDAIRAAIKEHEAGLEVSHPGCVQEIIDRLDRARLRPLWDLLPAFEEGHPDREALHVLVDEAQDTTPREVRVASSLGSLSTTWVGDPRQAIMAFRGGGASSLTSPTHSLTHSFRFGAAIADFANRVAAQFGGEPMVGLEGRDGLVETETRPDLTTAAGSVAVLCRTNHEVQWIAERWGCQPITRDPLAETNVDPFAFPWASNIPTVSTVHGMKGREADTVILTFDPLDPREKSAEAQRVAYVAVTRARTRLIVSPQEVRRW